MKVSRAPVYIRAYELTDWLLKRADSFPTGQNSSELLARHLQEEAVAVLEAVSIALSFRGDRRKRLQEANEGLLKLRLALRLAQKRQLLRARQMRYAMKEIEDVGRMIGGWLKYELEAPDSTEWTSPHSG